MANEKLELFTEILASDKLGAYQNYAQNMISMFGTDDPSMIWEILKWNPWAAMAVYEDMEEKDAQVSSCIDARKTNVLSMERNILPAGDSRLDKKIAEFVEETLKEEYFTDFEHCLNEMCEAIPRGVSIGEIIFENARDRIFISDIRFKPQHLFAFGDTKMAAYSTNSLMYPQTGPLQLRSGVMVEDLPMGGELPEGKFVVFSFRPKYGNRWGLPTARRAFWASWIKRNSIKAWLRYQEKGSGVVVARYPGSSGLKEQETALEAATAIQEESAVAVPDKFLLEVHEMVRNIGSSHKELVDDFCNAEINRVFLGGTLTSRGSDGGSGSFALGEVHERKEDKIARFDAKALITIVNSQIIRPLVMLNFGPNAKCPIWTIEYQEEESVDGKATRYGLIRRQIGLELSKEQLREDLQLEKPRDEEDTLGPAPEKGVNDGKGNDAEEEEGPDMEVEFSEKKFHPRSGGKQSSRTERFKRLRPSMIQFLDE